VSIDGRNIHRVAAGAEGSMSATQKSEAKYDYIVVGSGAGGAPAAARLAEQGFRVLVLEQGEDKPCEVVDVPLLAGAASLDKAAATTYFVQHYEDRERARRDPKYEEGKGIVYPRGTGRIGGSTQVNVMVWVRVDDADWDHCAHVTGDDFWRARNMRQILQLVERCRYRPVLRGLHLIGTRLGIDALRNRRGHGFDGYVETTRAKISLVFKDLQLLRISLLAGWYSLRLGSIGDQLKRVLTYFDPNDDRAQGTEGLALTPLTVTKQGRRGSVRTRLLDVREKHPENLEIRLGAQVRDIVLDDQGTAAVGVRYSLPDGTQHTEPVGREVILAAGTFETPAILMRSGIGPAAEVAKAGGAQRIKRAGVGQHLHDRYEIGVITEMKRNFALLEGVTFKPNPSDRHYAEWLASGSGVYATNGVVIGFQMKSDPALPDPDLYVFCLPCAIRGYHDNYFEQAVKKQNMCTWLVLHENKGDQEGTITLDNKDPSGQPVINFRYHAEDPQNPNDSRPLVVGVKAAREVIKSYGKLVRNEVWPGAQVQSDDALRAAIESNSWGHHANGSARMGRADDPMAVVDGDLKVIGTRNIRIADASVFPRSPGSFIVSAVVQVGEAAAIKAIAEARGQDPLAVTDVLLRQR
jgi:choline dehydrogenase